MPFKSESEKYFKEHIQVRHRGEIIQIPIESVIYFQADCKYVTVYHDGGQALLAASLTTLGELYADKVLQVHRSSLVMRSRVAAFVPPRIKTGKLARVLMRGVDEPVNVSRRYAVRVKTLAQAVALENQKAIEQAEAVC